MADVVREHVALTKKLASQLKRTDLYDWLVTEGYFPEPYVLPPAFKVTSQPSITKKFWDYKKRKSPDPSACCDVHFPKSELTDRTFGIIHPELHSDIAREISMNWKRVLAVLFDSRNLVASYSFPIPVSSKRPGKMGGLRSGRMIYEWITMAERDLAEIAFEYRHLIKTDVKNFYPSVYTHSIAWAIHGKKYIRKGKRRWDLKLLGNRLDKLFQSANDECTNGIPIGPAASDLVAELVLAGVDRMLSDLLRSKQLASAVRVVRFKDDYRILAKNVADSRTVLKLLQTAMKEFQLELSDVKTEVRSLPDGLFREWPLRYGAINPNPKKRYGFKRFCRIYHGVVQLDRDFPGTGVVDKFLADLTTRDFKVRLKGVRTISRAVSLLLLLGHLRTKAFPKILAIVGAILDTPEGSRQQESIAEHLNRFLEDLCSDEAENRYLISWIIYFLRSRNIYRWEKEKRKFKDPIAKAMHTSRFTTFKSSHFKIFTGVKAVARDVNLLRHLSVFEPQ